MVSASVPEVEVEEAPVHTAVVEPSLGVAWVRCLREVLTRGEQILDGPCRLLEVSNYNFTVTDIDLDEPLLRQFADQDRIRLMYRKYASLDVLPEYNISYGALLYDYDEVDQIDHVVQRLLGKRETKSATITLHPPGAAELSCLSLLDFKIRDGALRMTAFYRSQNVYASQPGNVLALRELQEQVAAKVDAAVGPLVLHAASAHIYEADLPAARDVVAACGGQVQ